MAIVLSHSEVNVISLDCNLSGRVSGSSCYAVRKKKSLNVILCLFIFGANNLTLLLQNRKTYFSSRSSAEYSEKFKFRHGKGLPSHLSDLCYPSSANADIIPV